MRRLLDVNTQLGADEADIPVERPADVQAVRTSDWHGPDNQSLALVTSARRKLMMSRDF